MDDTETPDLIKVAKEIKEYSGFIYDTYAEKMSYVYLQFLEEDREYFDEIDSDAFMKGNSDFKGCIGFDEYMKELNPYPESTQEWDEWNRGYFNAYMGYSDYLTNEWY